MLTPKDTRPVMGDDGKKGVKWSPRVPKWKMRRLYQTFCAGMPDEELIDDVGITLYLRCRDILLIHRVQKERLITCPRCLPEGRECLIPRPEGLDELLVCGTCGWRLSWRAYHRTFQREQLNPGGAVRFFRTFIEQYERARTPTEKMLAIDRVVHEFHYSLRSEPDRPTRPAGVNLIVGKLSDVIAFLDELSGLSLPEPMRDSSRDWQTKLNATFWPKHVAEKAAREKARTRRREGANGASPLPR